MPPEAELRPIDLKVARVLPVLVLLKGVPELPVPIDIEAKATVVGHQVEIVIVARLHGDVVFARLLRLLRPGSGETGETGENGQGDKRQYYENESFNPILLLSYNMPNLGIADG